MAVARDAASRGLRVLLLESGDIASGTSSRTSKLAHGGIRYLETGQLGLVREALREREILLAMAPAFVRPLEFLIPHYRGVGRSAGLIAIGLRLYAALAGPGPHREHRRVGREEARALEPALRPEGLVGGSLYWDAQIEDAPYAAAVAADAVAHGADVMTYTPLLSLSWSGAAWRARWRDAIEGSEGEAEAKCVVNAAGPWVDEIRDAGAIRKRPGPSIRRSRGTHVVYPSFTGTRALLLTSRRDGRVFFAIPWGAGRDAAAATHTLIGTTDVDDERPPGTVGPPPEDIRYLIEESGGYLAHGEGSPVRAFAGVRSLTRGATANPWANPREHRILEEGTMLSLIGGKYTTHRSFAAQVVDRVAQIIGARVGRSRTGSIPVDASREERRRRHRERYPGRVDAPGGLAIEEAEVVDAVTTGMARRLEDVLYRRTRAWLDARAVLAAADPVSQWMAAALGWSDARRREELERVTRDAAEERRRIEEATKT